MSDVFSLRRFGWLMRKIFLERIMQVAGTILLCFTVTFMVYAMTRLLQGVQVGQNRAFLIGLTLRGSLMASVVFNYFNNNAMGASFLTLPTSLLEK